MTAFAGAPDTTPIQPLTRREAKALRVNADIPATVTISCSGLPKTRREARAQRPATRSAAAPVAPAMTAAALFIGATGAAAASGNLAALPTPSYTATVSGHQAPDDEGPVTMADVNAVAPIPTTPAADSALQDTSRSTDRAALPVTQAHDTAAGAAKATEAAAKAAAARAATERPASPSAVAASQATKAAVLAKAKPVKAPPVADTPAGTTWVSPVSNYYISSGFGWRWGRLHAGIDFAGPENQSVRAVGGGVVIETGWDDLGGNTVYIKHPDGTVTYYAHLNRIDAWVGQKVEAGQHIGLLGNTGHSTGPHLHFEIHPAGGAAVNPAPWLRARGVL